MTSALAFHFFYLTVLLLSAIAAYIFRKSLRSRKLGIFVPYLIYVFIQELLLELLDLTGIMHANNLVYNIYRPVTVLVLAAIYYFNPLMVPLQKIIFWLSALYFAAFIIVYLFFDSILNSNGYLVVVRGFVITCFATFFLFRYFHLDNRKEEEFWLPLVWITIGIIIFYPVTSISLGFQRYLAAADARVAGFKLYQLIPQVLSVVMYSCFGYAFYLCKKKPDPWT